MINSSSVASVFYFYNNFILLLLRIYILPVFYYSLYVTLMLVALQDIIYSHEILWSYIYIIIKKHIGLLILISMFLFIFLHIFSVNVCIIRRGYRIFSGVGQLANNA